jgi:hypothetical protein
MATTMRIDFNFEGFEEVRARLQAMRERSGNLVPAWEAFATWWSRENREHWQTRGARWDTTWAPLSPYTLREKARLGYPLDPLVRTGALRRDLTLRPLALESFSQRSMALGTRREYAKFHQRGTSRMPRRRIVNARQVDAENAIGSAVKNWIVHGEAAVNPTEVLRR